IVGFCALEWLADGDAELDALFVEPRHIGAGHGLRLLAHAVATAQSRGVARIVIQADPNAAGFYESCGARRIGSRPSASIAGRRLPLYVLDVGDELPVDART
ncbi:MAG: GNAT family N-acetyltransferase, partial [Gammaproteobacteria bacterium]|nr:GNAT family N-acetyltransferase [Gammaproteobacteria bacterium]